MDQWREEIQAFTIELAAHKCGIPIISSGSTLLGDKEQQYLALYRDLLELKRLIALGGHGRDNWSELSDEIKHRLNELDYHWQIFESAAATFPITASLNSGYNSMEA
jgi:hypothetical protein